MKNDNVCKYIKNSIHQELEKKNANKTYDQKF